MNKVLSEAQLVSFATNGFVSGVPIFSPAEVAALEQRILAFERAYPDDVSWAFDIKCNLVHDWVVSAAAQETLLDAVEDLIGQNILLTNAVFRIKNPGSAVRYDWHQDAARIQVDPCFVIAFVAISAATMANGCLQVIPGSHTTVQPFRVTENPGQQLRRVARVESPDTSRAVPLELAPGEVAFFSANLMHASGPNQASDRRISILYDYTAAHARQSVGKGSGQLVRGHDRWEHFGHEPVPEAGFTPRNAQMRRDILRAYPENPLLGPREPGNPLRFSDAQSGAYAERP